MNELVSVQNQEHVQKQSERIVIKACILPLTPPGFGSDCIIKFDEVNLFSDMVKIRNDFFSHSSLQKTKLSRNNPTTDIL